MQLHENIDHLVTRQWQRLLEIQEIHLELMQEIGNSMHKSGHD